MVELQWITPEGTTTTRPKLQWRLLVGVEASGAFCPGPAGEWKDVPTSVVPAPVFDWQPKDPGCWCARCDMEHNVTRTRMSVCDKCGDKRCPRAEDHGVTLIEDTPMPSAVGPRLERGVRRLEPERADLLDMDYINSLPQPLWANHLRAWWPVHDIDVQTGLLRIDACGLLDVLHIGGLLKFRDDSGAEHDADDFYADSESWVNRKQPNVVANRAPGTE